MADVDVSNEIGQQDGEKYRHDGDRRVCHDVLEADVQESVEEEYSQGEEDKKYKGQFSSSGESTVLVNLVYHVPIVITITLGTLSRLLKQSDY